MSTAGYAYAFATSETTFAISAIAFTISETTFATSAIAAAYCVHP
ncbi:hypothetical protein [Nostoc sp. ChiVER01]|nr:hypothetical protein [Nostoc sp. ChiVER01]MDZ8227049.1 hypothetical protein [Nostoc sp. ChiVER01]